MTSYEDMGLFHEYFINCQEQIDYYVEKENYFLFSFIARISLSVRLSALSLCKDKTAQIATGSQPINVICNIRQMIPVKIFPRTMKDKKGRRMASNIINILIRLWIKIGFKSQRIFFFILCNFKIFVIFFRMHSHINHYNGKIDIKIFIFRAQIQCLF